MRLRTLQASLRVGLDGLSRKWRAYDVAIPGMIEQDEFDPEKLTEVQFVYTGEKTLDLWVDDVELVKGPGGWSTNEAEQLITVFGAKRAPKVKRLDTDHFALFTDSAAARKKFPRALETAREFAGEALGLPEAGGRLSVYVFQNDALYHDYCVRKGWTREAAERSAGHATSTYFATYYQSPDAPTVVHELTHALFQRAIGAKGGSWFQEGAAVHVEERWQKRSAAALFAPSLRGGDFVPLAEFVRIPTLIAMKDARGGARTGEALYAQAGAFFEFLLRGPYAERLAEAFPVIAATPGDDEELEAKVSAALGAPLAEIERAWIAWGSDPPR